MALLGAGLATLIRLQLGWPDHAWPLLAKLLPEGYQSGVMAPEFYLAVVTMHGTIMVFFFISSVLVTGFGNYLVPLQVGARDMAFPFLNMLSYWIALLSALVLILSFFVAGGAPAAGWTAYRRSVRSRRPCPDRRWARRSGSSAWRCSSRPSR